ncbi:M14 family zinc carboxypeptidase [Neolewinella agarilytica]|uniref:M14 family zinc carboxypeptidase n=1 Tax=Neolewinella agarilytica TaxID=478744 RepID=UPI002353B8FA|nr:M14 family zinc carboxypeptidase [Neolewinella agarilytica]
MRPYSIIALFTLLCTCVSAQLMAQTANSEQDRSVTYYLPDLDYNEDIMTPEQFLGWQIGDWHISHDLQQAYMRYLAGASDRITLEQIGRTYEDRPLLNLIITSPENHKNMAELQRLHEYWNVRNSDVKENMLNEVPAVLYQGFSIHGNEPSGGNAAPMVAYYYAAAPWSALEATLDDNIIVFDPCYNPDGFNRFASWANTHKNKAMTSDGQDREYNEAYPRGRSNHYWFDLNRDWLPVQHPESRARIASFHKWKPNVLTDHHEMGKDATFFFMPGAPTRIHPMTPKVNQELTAKIGKFHAEALDEIGSLYYSGEGYDDFYYGKGSTYPDINGCVGILFEQASSRGHLQDTDNGLLTFPFTIRNQVATALSTFKAFGELRDELLRYQRAHWHKAYAGSNGYVVDFEGDFGRGREFMEMMQRHGVPMKENEVNGVATQVFIYETPFSKAAFEPILEFEDSLFYDVSTFSLPMAFNLKYTKSTTGLPKGGSWQPAGNAFPSPKAGRASYAYLLPWDDYYAAKALYRLQDAGVRVKVSDQPFTAPGGEQLSAGTLMIPVGNMQEMSDDELYALITELEEELLLDFIPTETGTPLDGLMFGSRSAYQTLRKPEIALLVEGGVSSLDAGETWHLLDQRFGIPVTKLPLDRVGRADLSRYNTIIMSDGYYGDLGERGTKALQEWMGPGNVLITSKRAGTWAAANGLASVKTRRMDNPDKGVKQRPYAKAYRDRSGRVLGGAIYQMEGDLTHPLMFGLKRSEIPVFRRGTLLFEPANNVYATPLRYSSKPLLSGYSPRGFEQAAAESAGVIVSGSRGGRTISFADNMNFRAFWYGTNRLFLNAIFFGDTIGSGTTD